MTEPSQDIYLRAIDTDHLEEVEANPEAVQFAIKLSAAPTALWSEEFELAYRQTPYILKPPVQVEEDALLIDYLPRYTSELPGFLRFLTLLVQRANMEARRTEELHQSESHDSATEKFRAYLKRVDLPR